jgi:hypothetical protein
MVSLGSADIGRLCPPPFPRCGLVSEGERNVAESWQTCEAASVALPYQCLHLCCCVALQEAGVLVVVHLEIPCMWRYSNLSVTFVPLQVPLLYF